jgi:hypothetical protein
MDPSERMRTASRRLAEPFESLAQNIARHVIELVVEARLRRRGYAGPPILPGLQAEPGLQGEQ